METKLLKTVRFTKLVEESGQPEPVTLWTAPEEDRDFAKAMREARVLTVVQGNAGSKADYGLVGFIEEPLATFLVFPKKLAHAPGTKVVGIKYEQLAEPKPRGPIHKLKPQAPPRVPSCEKVAAVQESKVRPTHFKAHAAAAQPKPMAKEPEPPPQAPAAPSPPPPPPPPPKLYRFRANIEMTFRQVSEVEVEATTPKEAGRLIKEKMVEMQPDLATATVRKRASAPTKL